MSAGNFTFAWATKVEHTIVARIKGDVLMMLGNFDSEEHYPPASELFAPSCVNSKRPFSLMNRLKGL